MISIILMLVEWNADLVTGNEDIDNQHRELFDKTNQLYDAVDNGEKDAIFKILEFLGEYVQVHFTDEEKFMLESGYDGYEEHKKVHDELVEEVKTRKIDYIVQFKQVSTKISDLLRTTGPLSLQEIQIRTRESYFSVSTAIGLLYQDKIIDISSTEQQRILVSLVTR